MIVLIYIPFFSSLVQQQKVEAAWPHVLGIFTGHLYHFFTKVWPALGGRAWLAPPKWIVKKLGEKRHSNVAGMDFRKGKEEEGSGKKGGKKKISGKGKKLGGSSKK
jgi:hypothetical protein